MLAPCDKTRILIVDDDASILRMFQMILAPVLADVQIDLARDGATALEAFGEGHHAVLLMDLHMSGMDGLTAFRKIEELCKAEKWCMPSVVFCTGFVPSDSVRDVVAENPSHCLLLKPVTCEALVEAVTAHRPSAE